MKTIAIATLYVCMTFLPFCSLGHRDKFWECIFNMNLPRNKTHIFIKPKERDQWLHRRNDLLGENCRFMKLVFGYSWRLAKEMNYPTSVFVKKVLQTSEMYRLAINHLRKNPVAGDKLEVQIGDIFIHSFYQDEWFQKAQFFFSVAANWTDDRLSWGGGYSQLYKGMKIGDDPVKIRPKDIWKPDFAIHWFTHAMSERHAALEASVTKKGVIRMHIFAYTEEQCPMNYRDFPNDKHNCCMYLESTKYPDKITYKLIDGSTVTQPKNAYFPAWWKLISASKSMDNEKSYPRVKICLNLQRYSTTFTYKVVLPIAAAAFLAIVIPFFTSWKMQIGTKLLAIGLLFFTVVFTNNEHVGFGQNVPKFVKIYDFLIWTTVISVTFTVILWGLTLRSSFSPPHPMFTLVSGVINQVFCWTNPSVDSNSSFGEHQNMENGDVAGSNKANQIKNYNREWNAVYLGINNILLILFTFIYIVGMIAS